jgi:dihydroflavonol-4-reductase
MKKILIIGGQGFIGHHLIELLKQHAFEIGVGSREKCETSTFLDVPLIHLDLAHFSDQEVLQVLENYQIVIFAGGADDRTMPREEAAAFFYRENVLPCVRLAEIGKQVKLEKLIILGSYFTYFNRTRPDWQMAERHPYVRSRVLQQEETIRAAGEHLKVEIMELPYIFGSAPDKTPLWKPLVKYIKRTPWVFYTRGGTAMIGVEEVAKSILGAILYSGKNQFWQIGAENLTWKEMVHEIGDALGKKRTFIPIPTFMVKIIAWLARMYFKISGKQSGLDIYHFISTQTTCTYLHTEESMRELRYDKGDLKKSIRETVRASGY